MAEHDHDDEVTPVEQSMRAEPQTDPRIRIIKKSMHQELNWQGAKLTIAMAVVAVGTAFGAYRAILSEALAQTDGGLAPMKARVDIVEQEQKALRSDLTDVKHEVNEVQTDIRALYKAVMTGRPQERLEKPAEKPNEHKDGGR